MNIEEIKHLFVKVTERLPEKGKYFVIDCHDRLHYGTWDGRLFLAFDDEIDSVIAVAFTHWLDLSLLTTKSKALDLARDAVKKEESRGSTGEGMNFITENQNKL